MGDVPPPSSSPNGHLSQEAFDSSYHASGIDEGHAAPFQGPGGNTSGFRSSYEQHPDPSQNAFSAQFDMTQPQGTGPGPIQGSYNMSAMANALPQPTFRPGANNVGQVRYNSNGSPSGMMPPVAQYPGQSNMNHMATQQYYMAQHAPMPNYYNAQMPPAQQQAGLPPRHNMGYYPNQAMMNQTQQPMPTGYYYPHPGQYQGHNTTMPGTMMPNQYMPQDPRGSSSGYQASVGAFGASDGRCKNMITNCPGEAITENKFKGSGNRRASPNVVRGPPRKPRQSGMSDDPPSCISHATQIQIKTHLVTRPCHMDRKFAAANRTNELGTPCV